MILLPFTLLLTLTFKENTPGSILVHSALVLSWPLSGRRSALSYVQEGFCYSVIQLCPTLCNRIDHSMPGLSVPHHLPELAQTHVHWVDDAIQQSLPLSPSSSSALSLSQHQGLFWGLAVHRRWPQYWSFSSASVPPMNIQGWFPLGLTDLIFLLSKGLSRTFSSGEEGGRGKSKISLWGWIQGL